MTQVYIRAATPNDVPDVMKIIDEAKAFLKSYGSPQWQDGHPNEEMINADIENKIAYVLIVEGQVAGYSALSFAADPNYDGIYDGQWQNNSDKYAVIHRSAISANYRGQHLTNFLFSNLISRTLAEGIHNIRIDTHPVNKPMQHLVGSFGFVKRGKVDVDDQIDPVRDAFELNL